MRAADLHPGYRAEHADPDQAYEVLSAEVGDEFTTVTALFGNGKTDQIQYENDYVLPRHMACPKHPDSAFRTTEDLLDHLIDHLLTLEDTVTSNQDRVDQDAAALRQEFVDYRANVTAAIAGLKEQLAVGVTASNLNTTALDQLLADEQAAVADSAAEVTADTAPPAVQTSPPVGDSTDAAAADAGVPVAVPADGAGAPDGSTPPTAA